MKMLSKSLLFSTLFTLVGSLAFASDNKPLKPTEGQISAILTTANEGEIKAAQLAEKKGVDKEVKDFAAMMIKEHEKNLEDAKALSKKNNIKPDPSSSLVADLKKASASQEAELNKQKGPEFDRTYINQQVAVHTTLLDDLNNKLIPNAQNSDLKNHLENTKSHVEAHLVRARNIQTRLTR